VWCTAVGSAQTFIPGCTGFASESPTVGVSDSGAGVDNSRRTYHIGMWLIQHGVPRSPVFSPAGCHFDSLCAEEQQRTIAGLGDPHSKWPAITRSSGHVVCRNAKSADSPLHSRGRSGNEGIEPDDRVAGHRDRAVSEFDPDRITAYSASGMRQPRPVRWLRRSWTGPAQSPRAGEEPTSLLSSFAPAGTRHHKAAGIMPFVTGTV